MFYRSSTGVDHPLDEPVRVACCQIDLQVGKTATNRKAAHEGIHRAAHLGARLVVLPELVNSGYVFLDKAEAHKLAETVNGPLVQEWLQLSNDYGLVIVGGFCEALDNDCVSNSAVVIDNGRVAGLYRKVHLWDREKKIFTPGMQAPPVIDTQLGRIAMMVCYDLEFPEWVRLPALAGAEIVCVPTNWPFVSRPKGERPMELIRVQANASVNRIFIAVADRTGSERGTDWIGGSAIINPEGWFMTSPIHDSHADILVADCHPSVARDKRISPHNHVFSDRRPDLY